MARTLLVASVLLPLISAKCPTGTLQGPQDICLVHVNQAADWYEAEQDCSQRGGHLASVADPFSNSLLRNNACNCGKTSFWIGGSRDPAGYQQWEWSDGTRFKYSNWLKGRPTKSNTDLCTAVALNTGKWTSEDCNSKKPYICTISSAEEENALSLRISHPPACPVQRPACLSGWTYYEQTKKCYKILRNVRFYEASSNCESANATLVSIHSDVENAMLGDFVAKHIDDWHAAWIGLRGSGSGFGQWQWMDGTRFEYSNWSPGNPDYLRGSGCAYLQTDVPNGNEAFRLHWAHYTNCDLLLSAVCQGNPV